MKILQKSLLACFVAMSASASAAVVTYHGVDNGIGPGGLNPNSAAARAGFMSAAGMTSNINFEGVAAALNPTGVSVAPGASLTVVANAFGGIVASDQHSPTPLGFNTSAVGSKWLQMGSAFNSSTGATATFTFASGIDAFGFYLTDTQATIPGTISVAFNDGASQLLGVGKNATNGMVFFGFTDLGTSITSVSINTGTSGSTRDIFGIDDVLFSLAPTGQVPEPASLALAGLALVALGAARRRRKA